MIVFAGRLAILLIYLFHGLERVEGWAGGDEIGYGCVWERNEM